MTEAFPSFAGFSGFLFSDTIGQASMRAMGTIATNASSRREAFLALPLRLGKTEEEEEVGLIFHSQSALATSLHCAQREIRFYEHERERIFRPNKGERLYADSRLCLAPHYMTGVPEIFLVAIQVWRVLRRCQILGRRFD